MTALIYLDNSTTARPSEKVISQMLPYLTTHWGTPSVPHQKGQELYPALTNYYKTLYQFLGAHEEDRVILTSSGTEAVNHVIHSVYQDYTLPTGKNQFLAAQTDEAAAILTIGHLETIGCVGKMIPVNAQGFVTAQALADLISPRTVLVSLSWANGLTGVIQPLNEIAALCKQRDIRLHVDATHVLGKLVFDLEETGIDYLTFNGDQFHGPRGTGGLYIRRGIKASPFIIGGSDQAGLRAGALNMAGLAGLACAAQEALDSRDLLSTEIARLRDQLERGIIRKLPYVQVCFKDQERLPHCTTLLFPGISNEALLFSLNRRGLCASMGGGNFQQLSLLLTASGLSETVAHSALAFTLSRYTTEEEIERAIPLIVDCVQSLSALSSTLIQKIT
jgi:cysteine desulfurase